MRACAHELIRVAKNKGFVLLLVGHVTNGSIAGPRILEHMVDTVMYFEGDRGHNFRILRSTKTAGPTDEIIVFRMASNGLIIENPSALFLSQRELDINGVAVFAGVKEVVHCSLRYKPLFLLQPRKPQTFGCGLGFG